MYCLDFNCRCGGASTVDGGAALNPRSKIEHQPEINGGAHPMNASFCDIQGTL
jgi:hypothetical protein